MKILTMTPPSKNQQFLCFAINHFGTGQHPEARPETLEFFEKPYIRECVLKAVNGGLSELALLIATDVLKGL